MNARTRQLLCFWVTSPPRDRARRWTPQRRRHYGHYTMLSLPRLSQHFPSSHHSRYILSSNDVGRLSSSRERARRGWQHVSEFLVPTLVTARLRLRGFHRDDLAALAAIYADPAVMRYIRDGARTTAQTAANIEAYYSEWALHGYGVWAVVDRGSDTLLGMCGFVERAEIGYIFGRASWGRGIATEAAGACLWYGFTQLGFEEIGAGALEDNAGSRRVMEKLGMRPQANDYFDSQGGVYYHLPQADYHPCGPAPTLL